MGGRQTTGRLWALAGLPYHAGCGGGRGWAWKGRLQGKWMALPSPPAELLGFHPYSISHSGTFTQFHGKVQSKGSQIQTDTPGIWQSASPFLLSLSCDQNPWWLFWSPPKAHRWAADPLPTLGLPQTSAVEGALRLLFLWRPQLWPPTSSFTARRELSPGAISVGGEESCAAFNANAAVSKETGKSPDAAIRLLREIHFWCLPPGSSEVMKTRPVTSMAPMCSPGWWLEKYQCVQQAGSMGLPAEFTRFVIFDLTAPR